MRRHARSIEYRVRVGASVEVVAVRSSTQALEVKRLAGQFIEWLRDRYPELHLEIDEYLEGQNYRNDLANLTTVFGPPSGECVLGLVEGRPAGIVMFKRFDAETCEMNRLYVSDQARGHGLARRMCEHLIAAAVASGYSSMLLTALDRHVEALGLYRSLGFVETPERVPPVPHQVCMSLDLTRHLT